MADWQLIEEGLKRGYSLDEVTDIIAKEEGVDPSYARERGFDSPAILRRLGYVKPEEVKPEKGFIGNVLDQAAHGVKTAYQGLLSAPGIYAGNPDAERIAGTIQAEQSHEKPKEMREAEAAFADVSKRQSDFESVYGKDSGYMDSIGKIMDMLVTTGKEIVTNPKGMAYEMASQSGNMVAPMVGAYAGGKTGAVTGALLGPKGAVAGGVVGAGAGGFAGSHVMEQSGEFRGKVAERLSELGLEPTAENVSAIFQDKAWLDKTLEETRDKATGTAVTDGVLAAIGGLAVNAPIRAAQKTARAQLGATATAKQVSDAAADILASQPKWQKVAPHLKAGAIGWGGEPISEAAGQQYGYGHVDYGDVGMEAFAAAGEGIGSVYAAAKGMRTKPTLPANVTPPPSITSASSTDDAIKAFKDEVETASPVPRGSFSGMDDLAGLIESERSDLGKRRGLLAQQQQEARDMEAEFSELVKDEQIDQSYWLNDAQKQRDAERAREGGYDLALQQREEQQGRTVEQLAAASEAQGFGNEEPTAMQLAMQQAQQKALDNEFSGLLKQERASLNEMRANVKRVAGVPVEQISTPQLEEIAQSEAHPNTRMAAVAALNDRHDAIQQERERLMQLRETRLEKQSNQPEQGAQHGAESHGTDGQVATPSVAGGGANVSGGGFDAAMVAADRGMRETASAGAAVSSGGQVGAVPVADQPTNVRALTENGKPSASWVIRNKETGESLFETFDRKKVDALNTEKYEAVPILEYLQSLNKPRAESPNDAQIVNVRQHTTRRKPASNTIAQAIINLGGISTSLKTDILGDASIKTRPGLFTTNGTGDLGEIAAMLSSGFGFSQIDLNDPTDNSGAKQLADLIARSVNGETILNEEGMILAQQDEEFEQAKAEVNLQAQEIGVKPIRGKRTIDIVQSEINAILAEREEMSRQKKKAQLLLDEVAEQELIEAFDLAMQEYHDETAISRDESRVESARLSAEESAQGDGDSVDQAAPPAGRTGPTEGGRGEAEVTPEFGLVEQTEEEAIAEEQARHDAEAKRQREEQDAENKRQADAERDSFNLSGSTLPADELAARGQEGLFEQKADPIAAVKATLDAAGVTGTDRTSTIAAVRRGDLTPEDVAEAHPSPNVADSASEGKPIRPYATPDERNEAIWTLQAEAKSSGLEYSNESIKDAAEFGAPANEIAAAIDAGEDAVADLAERYAKRSNGLRQGFGQGNNDNALRENMKPPSEHEKRIASLTGRGLYELTEAQRSSLLKFAKVRSIDAFEDIAFSARREIIGQWLDMNPAVDKRSSDVAMFNAKSGSIGNPIDTATLESTIASVIAASPSQWSRDTVVTATLFADLPAPILAKAKAEGYDAHGRKSNGEKLTGVAYDGKVYLVQENISSEIEAEETLLHERIHQILHGNAEDKNGKALRQSLGRLYSRIGGKDAIVALAKRIGADMSGPLAALPKVAVRNRPAFLVDEFLAHVEGQRAYEKFPQSVVRAIREFYGEFRDWLRSSKFVKIADAVGVNIGTFTQSDLSWTLKKIRQQQAGTGSKAIRFMTAWHGSPHDHDGFDSSKIGTGEGAQAYGSGLYFSSVREIAEHYRNSLSDGIRGGLGLAGVMPSSTDKRLSYNTWSAAKKLSELLVSKSDVVQPFSKLDVVTQNGVLSNVVDLLHDFEVLNTVVRLIPIDVVNMLSGKKFSSDALLNNPSMLIDLLPTNANDLVPSRIQAVNVLTAAVALAAAKVHTGLVRFDVSPSDFLAASGAIRHGVSPDILSKIPHPNEFVKGRLYKVELAPEPDEYLDWDKPLSEQAKADLLRDVAEQESMPVNYRRKALHEGRTGEDFYKALSAVLGSDEAASKVLNSYGIRGIRYLDGSSRSAGNGTSNYVIFDSADVKITAKESRRASNDLDFTQPQGSEPLRKTSFGYANDTHNLFHVSTFKGNDGDVSTFDVYDTNTGEQLGFVSLGLRDGQITTLVAIEAEQKNVGFGEQLLRSLVARNPDGIYIINMLPEAVPFWQKMGVSLDEHFDGVWEHGNGVLTEEAIQEARNSERGIAAEDPGGRQKESRGNAESESGRQADNPLSSEGVANKTAPANAGVSVSAPTESVRRIQAVVERFKSQFKGASALDIRVVSTTFDIPARFRPSPFAEGVFHDDAGLVYLVTMNLRNPRGELSENRAWQVLLHESVGHYGLSQMMGDKFASILKAVKQATLAGRKVSETQSNPLQPGDKDYTTWEAVKLRYPKASDAEVAQEVLARMSETDPGSSIVGYAVATVRQWVRDVARAMGVNVVVSTSELRDLVAKASGYMRRGDNLAEERVPSGLVAASQKVGAGETAFNLVDVTSAAFKKWFGDSKVVDAYGKPLVVYHGTPKVGFTEFGTNNVGAFFSDRFDIAASYAGRYNEVEFDGEGAYTEDGTNQGVYETYLSIKNPLVVDWGGKLFADGPDGLRTDDIAARAKREGYDGLVIENVADVGPISPGIVEDNGVGRVYVAFSPTQIKSAISNTGEFNDTNPSILESRARPGTNEAIWDAPDPTTADNVIYTLQDKHIDLKRVQQAIKEAVGEIRDDIDTYLQEELFHGRAAKITEEFLDKEVNPLISLMRASNVSMEELETFLWARHAKERNAQIAKINEAMPDGGSGLTNKQADDIMAGKDVKIGDKTIAGVKPARKKLLSDLAGRVDAITRGNRALLERYSLESADTLNAWDGAYKHYVPLHREDAESHLAGMGTGQGYSVKGSSSKRATGSSRPVENILANLALQRERIITRGEKNRVAQSLYGLAKEMPNADLWEVDVKPTMRTTAMIGGREQVVDAIDPAFRSKPNVVFARFNGEDRFVVFNEHNERAVRMAQALKNLDADDISHLLGEVSRWTRYFASINTQYNPIFGVTNLVRDVQTGLLNLKSTPLNGKQMEMAGSLVHALPAVFKALRADRKGQAATGTWAQLWEEFQEVGGQTGYRDMFRNSHERAEALQNALDPTWWQKTWWGKAATVGGILAAPEQVFVEKVGKPLMELLSDYNTMMENGIRLSAYKLALDSGMTKERAASLAKNLTVNFNRKGQAARQVGAMYAFFNASIQGTARMAETLNHGAKPGELLGKAGKQIVYGGLLLGAVQAMLLMAAGFDDEEPPEFVRDRNIIIPTGNGKYVSIPMPLGFHVLPAISRISIEFTAGGFKKPGEHLVHIMDVLLDSFNPIGNAGLSMQTVAPTVLDPIAALTENKDWSGRQIARQDFSKLNPTPGYTRAKDTASSLSRGLAYAFNYLSGGGEYGIGIVSPTPDQIDYLLGQLTGGVGRELGKVLTTGETMATGEDLPPHKIPLVGRFYGDTTGQSSEASKFYGTLEKLSEHRGTLDRMKDAHASEAYQDYLRKHPESRLYGRAASVQREVANLRKLKRQLLDRGADRAKIRQVEDRMKAVMARFNQSASEHIRNQH